MMFLQFFPLNDKKFIFWVQVLALPLPHRPLFPGFYMPISVKVCQAPELSQN